MASSAHNSSDTQTGSNEDYNLFVSDPEDPEYGVLLEEDKNPRSRRSLSACAELLVNFETGEAYAARDKGFSEDALESLKKYCKVNNLNSPYSFPKAGRYDQSNQGEWDGDWHQMVDDVWRSLHGDEENTVGTIIGSIGQHELPLESRVLSDGSGDKKSEERFDHSINVRNAYTRARGSKRGYDNI
mgnify:CR=1 FL=1